MAIVARIDATAELDDPTEAVELARRQAREADQDEFSQLVRDWESGRVVVVAVHVRVELRSEDGKPTRASRRSSGVWLECDIPPRVESQVQEVVPNELESLASELNADGVTVTADELAHMFVHVELGPELRRKLEAGDGS